MTQTTFAGIVGSVVGEGAGLVQSVHQLFVSASELMNVTHFWSSALWTINSMYICTYILLDHHHSDVFDSLTFRSAQTLNIID
jgi:hypothetical protein